uniref:Integrin, alpha 11a n=1 Tax=Takifugu rubripes TaxID=31033 RepID=H2V0X7_TAKRU
MVKLYRDMLKRVFVTRAVFVLQACGPLWSYECGSSYYSTGICSRVNASFKFSRTIAPAFQSKLYLLSLKKIYGKCEVTAGHYFLIWKHLLSPSVLFIFKQFTGCETYMDIVIVLDGSNSIYPWYEVQAFLINILQKFYIGPGQIQVGVLQYGEKVVHEFKLSDYKSVEEVVKRARSINQRGGEETNTALGINVARSQAFKHGGRRGAKKVMIVITDGESHDSADLQQVIKDCEKDGITRYAIAVLGYYNRRGINPEAFLNEIKYIASDPDDKHFFNVTDEAALKDIVDALGERIFSLEGTSKNGTAFGLQMSQAGFSAHNVEDGILVGAVGAYDWNGGVLKETRQGKVVPPKSSYSLEFPEELKNHGAYLGYTVTSVVSARNGRLIVAGAPRFNHTGKVIIFTLKNSGELTILHSLKGQQIGSYYGSEIAPVDIDGDGITDNLLVAAPMFFSGGLEKGKVYIYRLTELNRFILEGALEIHNGGQNARFGSALAPVPDVNGDGFNDLVVGAPLEDDHKGAIYVFFSQQSRILRKYKQRIAAADLAPGLQYFGRSIHGTMDMNNDGSVDLAVGSLGAVVLLWSRSVIRIYTTVRFEPSKINIFVKDCQRGGKDVTCMSAIVCLNVTARTAIPPAQEIGIKYNVSIAERRFNPRAVLDNPAKLQPQNLTLLPGVETCKHIYFHVMETTDYARPIVFVVQVGLQGSDHGPVLDDSWPTVMRTELPFWNGCDEDERCMPDLALQSTTDLMTRKQFCAQPVHSHGVFCRHQSEGRSEGLWRIIEGNRRRMVVDVRLENKGENAYSARLNITYTPNLRFSSLIVKDTSDIKIDCYAEIKPRNEKICNVSAPFMRAKSQVSFRLEFEFSPTVVLDHVRVVLEANSDGEETNAADNSEEIYYSLNYEADLLFTRESHPSRYDIKSELALEEPGVIGPPFNLTFQIQNLGYFPVRDLQLNIEIPEMSKNGNRLLQISDFYIDKRDGTGCLPPQHAAPSRMATDELSHVSVKYKPRQRTSGWVSSPWLMSASSAQNQVDTLNLPFQCRVNVASRRDVAVRISGVMRIDNLHAVSINPQHRNSAVGVSVSGGFRTLFCCLLPFSSNFGSSNWWPVHQWSSPPPAPCFYPRRDPSDISFWKSEKKEIREFLPGSSLAAPWEDSYCWPCSFSLFGSSASSRGRSGETRTSRRPTGKCRKSGNAG